MAETELDKYQPRGSRIHPFDLCEMLDALPSVTIVKGGSNPPAVDESDYLRNRHDIGTEIEVNEKPYFLTTSIAPLTKGLL